ncbi:hypothetical protein METY_1359 [Methylopila sp. Yamaguchi]|nr:hypothetical protein METY_1359 [Methylopila sp. Yamaguchi]
MFSQARAISQFEDRLKQAGISVRRACREAGIAPSTWTRWKSGTTSPTLATWEKVEDAAEALIAGASQEVASADGHDQATAP